MGTMKPEYHEGPKALENFEKTMTALFRAPKTVTRKEETKRKAGCPIHRDLIAMSGNRA
jgi:hypothetical protein